MNKDIKAAIRVVKWSLRNKAYNRQSELHALSKLQSVQQHGHYINTCNGENINNLNSAVYKEIYNKLKPYIGGTVCIKGYSSQLINKLVYLKGTLNRFSIKTDTLLKNKKNKIFIYVILHFDKVIEIENECTGSTKQCVLSDLCISFSHNKENTYSINYNSFEIIPEEYFNNVYNRYCKDIFKKI